MQEFDFAIVGAGIAGVSAAYHLAPQVRAGGRVAILEREHVAAYHTTGRSAALHSETYGSAEIRAITVATGHFYRDPPKGFTDQRPGNELYGRVTRGGSGPCYGLVTESGQEYALHSTEGVQLKTGTWVRVRYTTQRARIDCGAGTPVSMVAVEQVK